MRFRRVSKKDANHKDIVRALRSAGRSVLELHEVGAGCPDLAVFWPGGFCLMEIKNPEGRDRIEPSQVQWHRSYRGPRGTLVVVRSVAEALQATGVALAA